MYTFKDYIYEKGDTEHARQAANYLNRAREKILRENKRRSSKANLKELEDLLNGIFNENGTTRGINNKTLVNKINEQVKLAYERTFDKVLDDSFNFLDVDTYNLKSNLDSNSIINNFEQNVKNVKEEDQEYITRTLKNAEQECLDILNYLNSIGPNNNPGDIRLNIKRLQSQIDIRRKELEGLNEPINLKMVTTGLQGEERKNIINDINTVHAFYSLLITEKKKSRISNTELGTILEFAMVAFGEILGLEEEIISNELVYDGLIKNLETKRSWRGPEFVNRGGKLLDMTIDSDFTKEVEFIDKKGQTSKKTVINLNDGSSIVFDYYGSTNAIANTQGKVDVAFNYKENDQATQLRASLKNWQQASRDFGDTSILNGIQRSFNSVGTVERYVMSLQHPIVTIKKDGSRKEYKNAHDNLSKAHLSAQVAIVADILLGYSQRSGHANIAILYIKGKGFKVLDLVDELEKYVGNDVMASPHTKLIGYNVEGLQNTAQKIRQAVLARSHKLEKGNTQNYYGIMYNYLKSQRVTLNYKAQLS